jgi:ribosomal protein S18 acetylase RimI-like enzyme
MVSSIQELKNQFINEIFTFKRLPERTIEFSKFLATFSKRNQEAQKVLDALVKRIIIPQKSFIIAEYKNQVVGCLTGILDPHGFLYVVDVLVHPDFRSQKIATSLFFKIIKEWGIPNQAKVIWLQVEIDNKEAMNLYKNLGLKKTYSYYYLEKRIRT